VGALTVTLFVALILTSAVLIVSQCGARKNPRQLWLLHEGCASVIAGYAGLSANAPTDYYEQSMGLHNHRR
jgi:hypothetical protein